MEKRFKKHKYLFLRCLLRLVKFFDSREGKVYDKGAVKRILLVTTTAIGDTLMSTPAIRAVRKSFPEARVAVLVHARTREVLEGNPYIDELITYQGKYKGLLKLIRTLRGNKFDLAIVLHANDPDIVPLVYLSGALWRVGWNESRFSFLFTGTYSRPAEPIQLVRQRLNIVKTAGVESDGEKMNFFLKDSDRKFIQDYLRRKNIGERGLVGLHPFGSHSSKRWPHIADFLNSAPKRFPDLKFVVIGGKNIEVKIEVQVNNVFSAAGELSLRQSAALIERCACLITTDSGPMHIALALNRPVIVLGGPTDLSRTGPSDTALNAVIQKDVECRPCVMKVCHDNRCMDLITADDVIKALEIIMKKPVTSNQ